MPATSVQIPWGSSQLSLSLPKEWQLLAVLEPASIPPVQDAVAEVQRALAEPTGSASLAELAGSGMKVALVIDDASRPTPRFVNFTRSPRTARASRSFTPGYDRRPGDRAAPRDGSG